MSLSSNITLAGVSPASVTFNEIHTPTPGKTRVDVASESPEFRNLILKSDVRNKGLQFARSVSHDWTKLGLDNVLRKQFVQLSIVGPNDAASFSLADTKHQVALIKSFLTDANIEAMLRGEL